MTATKFNEIKAPFNISRTTKILNSLPATFTETLKAHMKRLKITVEDLEERSLIPARTIQRMRAQEDCNHKITTLVAVCIGLKLNPILSDDLIRKSGVTFKCIEEHVLYRMLLSANYQDGIEKCNEIITSFGYAVL